MWDGIITRKLGMSEIYREDGARIPVTILRAIPAQVIRVLTRETDGYSGVRVGYEPTSPERLSKPLRGVYDSTHKQASKPAGEGEPRAQTPATPVVGYYRKMMEFRTENAGQYRVGAHLTPQMLSVGEKVDATGYTKGRGFTGVVKRYRFGGGKDSHGTSVIHRRPNSIGCRWPQRVIRGKRMAGHSGSERRTVKNLEIVRIDGDLVYVKGAVPAPTSGVVVLKPARGWGGQG